MRVQPSRVLEEIFALSGKIPKTEKVVAIDNAFWPIHILTQLELLSIVRNLGSDVLYYQTSFGSKPSFFYPYLLKRDQRLIKLLNHVGLTKFCIRHLPYRKVKVDSESREILNAINRVGSMSELRAIEYGESPVGYTLVSTLVSQYHSTDIPLILVKKWAKKYFLSYIQGLKDAQLLHQKEKYESFLVFNGRFPYSRGVSDYATRENLNLIAHDVQPNVSKYTFLPLSIHSPKGAIMFQEILESVEELENLENPEFFESRRNRTSKSTAPFARRWGQTSLEILPRRPYVTIFTSSDHEHYSINSERAFQNGMTQMEWLQKATNNLLNAGFDVAVRIHPNAEISKKQLEEIWISKFGSNESFRLYDQWSSTDSYVLAENSLVVICTFSTIAVECAFMGIPVLSVNRGLYDEFIQFDKCKDVENIVDKVKSIISERSDSQKVSLAREGALRFSHFQQNRFFDFELTPRLEDIFNKHSKLPPTTMIYKDLRQTSRLESLLVRGLFVLRFRLVPHPIQTISKLVATIKNRRIESNGID